MAATAADLSTYVQTVEPAVDLRVLTNPRDNTAASINTTFLEAYCEKAINWFGTNHTTYDPDQFPIHQDAAHYKTMALLFRRAGNTDESDNYEDLIQSSMGLRGRRTLAPQTNSTWTPSVPSNTVDRRPAFDDQHFEGYSGDRPGGIEPPDDTP